MDIIKITGKKIESFTMQRVLSALRTGGMIVYPTDTAYGLGVDALNEDAIGKIFIVKKRVQKALPVIVANLTMLKTIAEVNPLGLKLAKKYWPGPLTIIFKKKPSVPLSLTLGMDTIGVKIPKSPVALEILKAFGRPLTSTSANISGTANNYTVDDVLKQFRDQESRPDLVLDGGALDEIPVSTVVDTTKGSIRVLRKGPVDITK
ncbi:MAG: L-threonylcarbamoyladenylate synthase [Patescibacteria group bacterium]